MFVVAGVWCSLLALCPRFFLATYVPGYLIGLALCYLHGHYEHVDGTTSHHGMLYNLLFFNDGYHVEHHAAPGTHWTRLPARRDASVPTSRWPAVLRWLDQLSLEGLERLVIHSKVLQGVLLRSHEQAFRALLPHLPRMQRIAVIGGGLWPRTPLILRRLLPQVRLVVIDRSAANIATARAYLPGEVEFVHALYEPKQVADFDLVVFPLAFIGDRTAVYSQPAAPAVLVHDWFWRRRGTGVMVSWLLLKRLNLVMR
jgi:hypothetical protein